MHVTEPLGDDEELLAACKVGDEGAWRELIARFNGLVWDVARGEHLTPAECEEVSQHTWYKLALHIRSIRQPSALKAWLAVVARNHARDERRYRARTVPVDDPTAIEPEFVSAETPETTLLHQEQLADLRGALLRLPAHCRVLIGKLFADPPATYGDLARELHVQRSSVGPIRTRCMRCLRQVLAGSSGPPAATARAQRADRRR